MQIRQGVEWRYEHDVIGRESRVHTRYGGPYEGAHGTSIVDCYEGSVGISTADLSKGWVRGRSRYDMTFPLESGPTVCSTEATLDMTSDSESFHVNIHVRAERDGVLVAAQNWTETFTR